MFSSHRTSLPGSHLVHLKFLYICPTPGASSNGKHFPTWQHIWSRNRKDLRSCSGPVKVQSSDWDLETAAHECVNTNLNEMLKTDNITQKIVISNFRLENEE